MTLASYVLELQVVIIDSIEESLILNRKGPIALLFEVLIET